MLEFIYCYKFTGIKSLFEKCRKINNGRNDKHLNQYSPFIDDTMHV